MHILLIEENRIVREAIKDALELHSNQVYEAHDGRDALAMIQDRSIKFDLVISDLVMPHMNALELYEALAHVQVDVRLLIITGYPMPRSGQSVADRPGVHWMQKPVQFRQLGKLVRQLAE